MPITPRDITQGRQDQGSGETVVYTLTTTNWGSSPSSPSITVYDVTGGSETDVTITVAPSGSTTAAADVITFKPITSLTAGQIYRVDVAFTTGSNTLTVQVYIHCNAFTYLGDLSSNRDRVRLYLADTDPADGPLPSDRNFSDNEIDGLITIEGSWQRAVAAGFEALASAWRRYPSHTADGLQFAGSDIAKGYAEDAKDWRKRYGGSTSSVGTRHPTRVDGYSSDVASDTA